MAAWRAWRLRVWRRHPGIERLGGIGRRGGGYAAAA